MVINLMCLKSLECYISRAILARRWMCLFDSMYKLKKMILVQEERSVVLCVFYLFIFSKQIIFL